MRARRLLVVITVTASTSIASCGGGESPTSPGAGPGPGGDPTITLLMIHNSGAWLRPGDQEDVTANARFSDGATRNLTAATWESLDTSILTVDQRTASSAVIRAVAPGETNLQVASAGATQRVAVRVAAVTPPPGPGPSASTPAVLISEFRMSGPGGAEDEFIELRNVSGAPVSIDGWSIAISNGAGTTDPMGDIPSGVTLGPNCSYLLISGRPKTGGTGEPSIAADFLFRPTLDTNGGLALLDGGGRIVDQVGLSSGSAYREGDPLSSQTFSSGGSFERTSDSGDNAADFEVRATSNRQNRESPCGSQSVRR